MSLYIGRFTGKGMYKIIQYIHVQRIKYVVVLAYGL